MVRWRACGRRGQLPACLTVPAWQPAGMKRAKQATNARGQAGWLAGLCVCVCACVNMCVSVWREWGGRSTWPALAALCPAPGLPGRAAPAQQRTQHPPASQQSARQCRRGRDRCSLPARLPSTSAREGRVEACLTDTASHSQGNFGVAYIKCAPAAPARPKCASLRCPVQGTVGGRLPTHRACLLVSGRGDSLQEVGQPRSS